MKPDLPLLFDTHTWIWLAHGEPGRIKPAAMRVIENAGSRQAIRISVVSVWEIALLESRGRLELPIPVLNGSGRRLTVPISNWWGWSRKSRSKAAICPGPSMLTRRTAFW